MAKKPHQQETFRDMCHNMEKGTPVGDAGERGFNWGRKAKTSFRYDYTGNEGQACQLPLTKRKENVLKAIEKRGEQGVWVKRIEPTVLEALLKDESVYLNRSNSVYSRRPAGKFFTNAVSTNFPSPDKKTRERRREQMRIDCKRAQQEIDEGYPTVDKAPKKTIKWTKDKHQKLLIDAIMGQADEDVVKQVTRTKTLPKKIKKKITK